MELFSLLEKGNTIEIIKFIENNRVDINSVDKFTFNLLMKSINRGITDLSEYLIEQGVDLNYQNEKGQTILHLLAINYDKKILEKALEKGVNVNLQDIYGNEALWTAVFNDKGFGKRIEMIQLLIKYGANPYHSNNAGKSPIEFAKTAGYPDVIGILDINPV